MRKINEQDGQQLIICLHDTAGCADGIRMGEVGLDGCL